MEKNIKIMLIALIILIGIVVFDTIQAKIFDNNPILKIVEDFNGENIYQKHKGILVDTYIFTDGTKKAIFKWEKYDSSINSVTNKEQSFHGKVVESTNSYIIVEPNENEEIRKSADKISIGLEKNNDMVYTIGTNVKITYVGGINESYPAQVKATKIELKSAENFEIFFYEKHPWESYKIYTILGKIETEKYDYTIYGFDGIVNVSIDGKNYSLKEALLESKITMEEIIEKADKDFPNAVSYDDGGSKEYHYENYTIIKCHTLDGNRDVYIGTKDLKLNDLKI